MKVGRGLEYESGQRPRVCERAEAQSSMRAGGGPE